MATMRQSYFAGFYCSLLLLAVFFSKPVHSETFFTSFEFTNRGTFSIGEVPFTATFSGGAAQTVGNAAYYHSGRFSWHVPSAGIADVTFETPVEVVDFWFRDTNGATSSSYRIIDTNDAIIGSGKGTQSFVNVELARSGAQTRIARIVYESVGGGDTVVDDFGYTVTEPGPPPDSTVNLSGSVETTSGTPLCAMVLASGRFQFSCNPNGPFSLTDLPRENDGTVKRQVYVDGFFPNIESLTDSTNETVFMQRAGSCPDYNEPYSPGLFPDSAGKRIDISGAILLQNSGTPICAMVLANGQFMFSCDGTGSYGLKIPLDADGQFKLQVYADGFAPKILRFDEFSPINDVRLARDSECQ